jgi:gluconate 2-dehydrogenase gamma chain
MNRKPRPSTTDSSACNLLSDWRQQLLTRRQLLIAAAGGSLAAIFPTSSNTAVTIKAAKATDTWSVIEAVQQHLFPEEDDSPGAREINALGYLQFVVSDTTLDADSRHFITKGAAWLEDMAATMYKKSFIKLDEAEAENVLRRIAGSEAGENWLSTLLLYIVEALLTDPVYGGNTEQRGWLWLQHVPGFPRPPADKTFPKLLT